MSFGNNDFSTRFELLPIGAYRSHPDGVQVRAKLAMVELFGFKSEAEMLATTTARAGRWYVDTERRNEFRWLRGVDLAPGRHPGGGRDPVLPNPLRPAGSRSARKS